MLQFKSHYTISGQSYFWDLGIFPTIASWKGSQPFKRASLSEATGHALYRFQPYLRCPCLKSTILASEVSRKAQKHLLPRVHVRNWLSFLSGIVTGQEKRLTWLRDASLRSGLWRVCWKHGKLQLSRMFLGFPVTVFRWSAKQTATSFPPLAFWTWNQACTVDQFAYKEARHVLIVVALYWNQRLMALAR